MGTCASCTSESNRIDSQIQKSLDEKEKIDREDSFDVLLSGPSRSGKSTLFRQIQRVAKNKYSFNANDRDEARSTLRFIMVEAMFQLLRESQKFGSQGPRYLRNCFLDVDRPFSIELPNQWKHVHSVQSQLTSETKVEFELELESCSMSNHTNNHDHDSDIDANKINIKNLQHFNQLLQTSINSIINFHSKSRYIHKKQDYTNYNEIIIDRRNNDDDTKMNSNQEFDKLGWSNELGNQLGNAIAFLWELPAIKRTFDARYGTFSFPDNMDYFFNKGKCFTKKSIHIYFFTCIIF